MADSVVPSVDTPPSADTLPSAGTGPLAGKRVVIGVENLPVPLDRRVWQEALALRDAGADVTVICPVGPRHPERVLRLEGIDVLRFPLPVEASGALGFALEYTFALFWLGRLTWRVARRGRIDVFQACNPPDLLFLIGWALKRLNGTRFIFDQHDVNPELYGAKFARRDFFWHLLVWLERRSYKTADAVIATNGSFREIAATRGRVPEDRIFIVQSGPDLERFRPLPPDPAWRKGARHLVGYVGIMGAQDGLDLLVQAADVLINRMGRRDVHFLVIGDGPERRPTEAMTASFGLTKHFTFTGYLTGDELLVALSSTDVCVACDRFSPMSDKSTMNKIMEYMALSRPVVQFELTEGRRSAGDTSLYAKPDDPDDLARRVAQLLDDPALARRLGEAGRLRVHEKLAWRHQVPQLIAAYRLALTGR